MIALNFIWNSNEIVTTILGYPIRYYSLMFVAAFSLGWYLTKKIYLNDGKTEEQLDSLFVYTVIATLVGARLGDCFFYNWDYYQNHLLEIFLPFREKPEGGWELTGFSGLASHGAAIGIIIAMILYVRKYKDIKLSWILDRVVIPITIGGMFVRFGNFFNSEINGKIVSDSFPLGVKFVQGGALPAQQAMEITQQTSPQIAYELIARDPHFADVLRSIPYQHPAQLYEAFGYFCLFWVLWYVYWKTNKKEQPYFIFGLFLVALWSIRFGVEFVKESQGGFESTLGLLSTGQWLSLPFILAGFYLLFRKRVSKI